MSGPVLNTDRELFREPKGDLPSDYYANSIHVTTEGNIGMNVGGLVITLPIAEWHRLAAAPLSGARAAAPDALRARVQALAAEIEDPRTQRPGMQRRRIWAQKLRALLEDGA